MKSRFGHAAAFGILAAIASVILALVLYMATGPMSGWNYLSYVFALVIFGWGAKKWAGQQGGYITFGQAYLHMLIQALIYTAIIATWTYIFFVYIAPASLQDMLLRMQVEWENQGLSQAQIDKMLSWFTAESMTITAFVINLLIFSVVNLIVAAIVKNDPPPMSWNENNNSAFPNTPPQA